MAQGLSFGTRARGNSEVPVLPVDTLLAVAEEARHQHGAERVVALLDARMDEVYAGRYAYQAGHWQRDGDFDLIRPEALQVPDGWALAGNAMAVYGARLPSVADALQQFEATACRRQP